MGELYRCRGCGEVFLEKQPDCEHDGGVLMPVLCGPITTWDPDKEIRRLEGELGYWKQEARLRLSALIEAGVDYGEEA